jgi:hypothetical protein
MNRFHVFLFLLTLAPGPLLLARTDSARQKPLNTGEAQIPARQALNPRRATLLSAVLPGAGQVYNRRYWKVPVLYGGAFALGYFVNLNHKEYLLARDSYLQVRAGKPDYYRGFYNAEQLVQLREYWRRNRDLLIIVSGVVYLLNIADAAVDAHLSGFDVGDDLSLNAGPAFIPLPGRLPAPGLRISLTFASASNRSKSDVVSSP